MIKKLIVIILIAATILFALISISIIYITQSRSDLSNFDIVPLTEEAIHGNVSSNIQYHINMLGCKSISEDNYYNLMLLPALGYVYLLSDESYTFLLENKLSYSNLWEYFIESTLGNNKLRTMRLTRLTFLHYPKQFSQDFIIEMNKPHKKMETALLLFGGIEAFTLFTTIASGTKETALLSFEHISIAREMINSEEYRKVLSNNRLCLLQYFTTRESMLIGICPSYFIMHNNSLLDMRASGYSNDILKIEKNDVNIDIHE